jgi:hypothetical protein
VLEQSDVRALNERELTVQEKEEIRRVRERGGVIVEEEDANAERVIAGTVAVGEGQRRPSWIWYSGNSHESVDDPLTRLGKHHIIFVAIVLANIIC